MIFSFEKALVVSIAHIKRSQIDIKRNEQALFNCSCKSRENFSKGRFKIAFTNQKENEGRDTFNIKVDMDMQIKEYLNN